MTKHKVQYQDNYPEGTTKAFCSCGWWVEDEIKYDVLLKAQQHLVSPTPVKVVEANFVGESAATAAKQLREIADLVEAGQVRDIVVVYDYKGKNKFCSNGLMDDRWRLLGAIEYAKKYVME